MLFQIHHLAIPSLCFEARQEFCPDFISIIRVSRLYKRSFLHHPQKQAKLNEKPYICNKVKSNDYV
jgi:hypothetical protein